MKELQKKELEKALPNFPHRIYPLAERQFRLDEWEEAGCPFQWIEVDQKEGYTAYVDAGYGWIALFTGNQLIDVSRSNLVGDEHVIAATPTGVLDDFKIYLD